MFVIKIKIVMFVLSICFINCHSLNALPPEVSVLVKTESIIRNTTNGLFKTLKLRGLKGKPRLHQYSLVHNFFTTVTLKEHSAIREVITLSRANTEYVNNETETYALIVNDILNEPNQKSVEITDVVSHDDDIVEYVADFLTTLDGFKKNSSFDEYYENLDINEAVLNIMKNKVESRNASEEIDIQLDSENLLNVNEFWVPEPATRRIYRGDRTKIKYFPFMASIQMFDTFHCAGSIVKSDLILTAASCLQLAWNNRFFRENPSFLSVRVGSNFYNGGGESFPIMEVYFHPGYNPRNLRDNMCMLRLFRKIKFRKNKRAKVQKIALDTDSSPLPMNTDGITIVGWGATGPSNILGNPWKNQLAFAVLDVYHIRECQEIYSREYVTKKHFCAGFVSKGGGACNHDVGGPGIVNGLLTGVISFGSPVCGTPDAPTVFSKVGYYIDWIEEIKEQDVPNIKKRTTLKTTTPLYTFAPHSIRTTFKIDPLGIPKPIPIDEIDKIDEEALKILRDENLFKDFVNTMFGSKEAEEYKDLLSSKVSNDKVKTQYARQHAVTKKPQVTKLFEDVSTHETRYTILENKQTDKDLNSNIANLIDNMDLTDDTESETDNFDAEVTRLENKIKVNKKEKHQKVDKGMSIEGTVIFKSNEITSMKERKQAERDNDNLLTLLYISDSEKNNSNIGNVKNKVGGFKEDVAGGLSITSDEFQDFTYRANITGEKASKDDDFLDFISKDELYDLLSETIDELTKNKDRPNL